MRISPSKFIKPQQVQLLKEHRTGGDTQRTFHNARVEQYSSRFLIPCYFVHFGSASMFRQNPKSLGRFIICCLFSFYKKEYVGFALCPSLVSRPSHCPKSQRRTMQKAHVWHILFPYVGSLEHAFGTHATTHGRVQHTYREHSSLSHPFAIWS